MTEPASGSEGSPADRRADDDVDALRREVDRLTAENDRLRAGSAPPPGPARHRARGFASVALVVVASLLVPVGVVGVWLRSALTDTDRYVETVAPLVRDRSIQRAAATRVTAALLERVDVEARVADALPPEASFLASPLTSGIENVVRDLVDRVVASERFATLWDEANRLAHEQVLSVLRNRSGRAGVVQIDLTRVVTEAARRLDAAGLSFFGEVAGTPVTFTLVQSQGIARVQVGFSVFDRLAPVLPWVAILMYAAAVVLATDRRRALVRAGGGVMVGALVLLLGLGAGRALYLGSLPPGASLPANEAIFDTLTRFLRGGGRTVLAIGLVMVVAGVLAGSGATVVRLRQWAARLLDRAGSEAGGGNAALARAGAVVARHLTALRATVGGVAVLTLLAVDRPSGGTILWLGALTAAALVVVEVLGRAGAAGVRAPEPATPTP
jgi:hypothetical protein